MKLSEEERDLYKSGLDDSQRVYLEEVMARGRRTVFANTIAKQKGHAITENASLEEVERLIDSWVYEGFIDAGKVDPRQTCECGRALRYQHIVKYKPTGEYKKFGISHLELHTGIDAKTAHQIISGFSLIDFELDEILMKLQSGWSIGEHVPAIPSDLEIPEDIMELIRLNLPLLDRQLLRLKKMIRSWEVGRVMKQSGTRRNQPLQGGEDGGQLLFSFEQETAVAEKVDAPAALTDAQQEAILGYLYDGIGSARELCELLIKEHGASPDRLSTGKPDIYPLVCRYLDMICGNGKVRLARKDYQDRIYSWI
ncbi:DUF3895 domain-containing protein [Paenibacillus thermotolerans]|uniref:DUF3895 domain-containing protein n=1 Tax=Paenibacillus thermotolerans TaxID=3027807 RepID=UPI002368817E|nr:MULTISPECIES: DUF3895 domain-containing protein [unclassified Paenibacillus]